MKDLYSSQMYLARSLDNNEVGDPIGLPKSAFNKHLLIAGITGVGKSVTGVHAALTAHQATDGATVIIDPKGEWAKQLARSAHARRGHIDDVLYFKVAEALPAISFFDIQPAVDAGRSRGQEVRAVTDHFLTILDHVMASGFDAIRAPDVIRYLLIALYDPVEGSDRTTIDELVESIYRLRSSGNTPNVSPDWSENLLDSLKQGNSSMFQTILQGAVTRVEKIYGNGYLRPMFNHLPEETDDVFRFEDHLYEDTFIIFDLGGITARSQQIITNALLSLLWRGLQNRRARTAETERKQTMLFIDEVPYLGIESRLSDLLSLSRSYGLGIVPMMQYPKQLEERSDEGQSAYTEVLNNCHSLLLGKIPVDDRLVQSLKNSRMSTGELENRLGNMRKDRWLLQIDTPRGEYPTGPHLVADLPLPAGHPEAPPEAQHPDPEAFEEAFNRVKTQTATELGVEPEPYELDENERTKYLDFDIDAETVEALQETNFSTTLPLVTSMPGQARYDTASQSIECKACESRFNSTFEGLQEALNCHGDLDSIDRSAIPPVALDLSLSSSEISDAPVRGLQLVALQILYNIGTGRYDRREVDLVFDTLPEVLDTLGIQTSLLSALVDEGYLNRQQIKKHVYYTVTDEGRDLLAESNRRGIDWGHGEGDITETLLHRAIVDALARYLQQTYVDDPECPADEVIKYFEPTQTTIEQSGLSAKTRFDVATLTADGEIHGIGEAELSNNDRAKAAVRDFDKIAAVEPDIALWGVASSSKGQEAVIQPLISPPDGDQRIKSYSSSTRIKDMSGFNSAGLTNIMTLSQLRDEIDPPELRK